MDFMLESGASQIRRANPQWQKLQRRSPKLFRAFELFGDFQNQLMHHLPHAWRSLAVAPSADASEMDVLLVQDTTDEQLTIDWAVLVGDIVHNARSALDHAAWQLVGLNGGTPGTHTQFPTARASKDFDTKTRLRGAHPYVHETVRALEPWGGGAGHWLWVLTQLDNVDKHRLLLDVNSSSNSNVSIQDPETGEWRDQWISTEGRQAGDVVRTAPRGTMKVRQSSATMYFEHHDGDAWDGNAPQGYKINAQLVLEFCLTAAGDAHDAMGRADNRRRRDGEARADTP
ncbi:hypothetical protein [Cellulomonas shaoxiangyii]|uniref:Uncharacterized protein n=1 Tax=Cellulomonas shaoxiangyii TaxID=2566013 RepID=A0A4V1CN03_9CELL|nr:hypothetical protein [Cellulomonas shaoxiangyii]QCB94745.1 hypothetical protein E5225_15460 [Cellulomonas shaoxiangyii]TGY86475.1 hypothetical protein E5226_01485 [Cellulomonas shaoxiangyii]